MATISADKSSNIKYEVLKKPKKAFPTEMSLRFSYAKEHP